MQKKWLKMDSKFLSAQRYWVGVGAMLCVVGVICIFVDEKLENENDQEKILLDDDQEFDQLDLELRS